MNGITLPPTFLGGLQRGGSPTPEITQERAQREIDTRIRALIESSPPGGLRAKLQRRVANVLAGQPEPLSIRELFRESNTPSRHFEKKELDDFLDSCLKLSNPLLIEARINANAKDKLNFLDFLLQAPEHDRFELAQGVMWSAFSIVSEDRTVDQQNQRGTIDVENKILAQLLCFPPSEQATIFKHANLLFTPSEGIDKAITILQLVGDLPSDQREKVVYATSALKLVVDEDRRITDKAELLNIVREGWNV